ncbi:MAG: hypothetical protein SFT91_03670 [Rickettsiaceae bacterium]|nr:hypothetical protein [Rickettsiaceae bacterium]
MDEHFWIAICFGAFFILSYKKISVAVTRSIQSDADSILTSIKEAEEIYLNAKEKHQEAKDLLAQLDLAKKYIHEKEEREIEFDLEVRKKQFDESIKIKKSQIKNQNQRTIYNLKNDFLHKLNISLKKKFISYITSNKEVAEQFTNIMLHQK